MSTCFLCSRKHKTHSFSSFQTLSYLNFLPQKVKERTFVKSDSPSDPKSKRASQTVMCLGYPRRDLCIHWLSPFLEFSLTTFLLPTHSSSFLLWPNSVDDFYIHQAWREIFLYDYYHVPLDPTTMNKWSVHIKNSLFLNSRISNLVQPVPLCSQWFKPDLVPSPLLFSRSPNILMGSSLSEGACGWGTVCSSPRAALPARVFVCTLGLILLLCLLCCAGDQASGCGETLFCWAQAVKACS